MPNLDPASAAYYALIVICLVTLGAILTAGVLSVQERGSVLAAIVGVLAFVAWRAKRPNGK